MLPSRKRKRSTNQDLRMPKSISSVKQYFMERFLDVNAPCTADHRSPQKRCWITNHLSLWNSLLHPVGIRLREDILGKLTLETLAWCNPSTTEYRVVSAFLVKRLLNNHCCIQHVDLSYAGELFSDHRQQLSRVRLNAGLQQITLDGCQVSQPELCQLVRVILQGDPVRLKLCHVRFGATGMTSLVQSVATWTRLADLDLSENGLRGCDSLKLLEAVDTCKSIKYLKLDSNMVGVRGAQRLAKLLTANKTLLRLSLFKTKIQDKGAVAIGHALAANNTLESLMIGENSIGSTGARAIASSLKVNTSLICLDLRYNDLANGGAIFIAQMLPSNKTLRELHLCGNEIGEAGIVAVADSLANNSTLLELCLDGNLFDEEGVAALARLISCNKTLRRLSARTLQGFGSAEESHVFIEALALNQSLEGITFSVRLSCATEMLSQKLRCHETLQDLCIHTYLIDITLLFDALAANRSLRTLEVWNYSLDIDVSEAFENLLRTTKTIRAVSVSNRVSNAFLMRAVIGLAQNASIWRFHVVSGKLGVKACEMIAILLMKNRTLSAFIMDDAPIDKAGLKAVASGLSSNRFLQQLSVTYAAPSAAGFSVSECLRRNGALLNHALQFALKRATDKSSAAAFQLYQRSEFFAYELSRVPEVMCLSSAELLIQEAKNYILRNYFIVTGVVKRNLICRTFRRGTVVTTQFDKLNAYCLYAIASYLQVADVKR
ncbi:leucine rich repeat and NACHT domain-containing protein, putative [Ixodes scapularis]|uniref:Leucine rich repeat and NACHT domain-containing protein, putative n=1 Tax=Ixodes scapularis TaxID=6945 RepID=B7PI98_IXOSC|nr:leucine rich repeat and NACHT domain-containing protein, putative [Ixodes scapularis]|eukprot:XP_002404689.1 leucine rich repeat and NACHT domain-containing protein, putative [Ixodes scapularis]